MTALEHFKALVGSYPLTDSDYTADGEITPDAAQRITTWALEALSEAERTECNRQWQLDMVMEHLEGLVNEGMFVKFTDEATGEELLAGAFLYGKDERQTAQIDALVAAGSHYRGQDDKETGEARFFAVQREEAQHDLRSTR